MKQPPRRTLIAIHVEKFRKFILDTDYSDFNFQSLPEFINFRKTILGKLRNELFKSKANSRIPCTAYQLFNAIVLHAEILTGEKFPEFKVHPSLNFLKNHEKYLQTNNKEEDEVIRY